MSKSLRLVALAAVAMDISACGNVLGSRSFQVPIGSSHSAFVVSDEQAAVPMGYDCPEDANVSPDYDLYFDGSGYYKVCTKQDSQYDVIVRAAKVPAKTPEDAICVFPAQYVDSDHIFAKLDAKTFLPMSYCQETAETDAYMSFPYTNYNAVFVTKASDKQDMETCLKYAAFDACPAYSYGKFR